MASNAVLVAIPARYESVWKVSSEKVPHLTILYLNGDAPYDRIEGFLEHALKMRATPFVLDAERRGTLGDDDADVLFFSKESASYISELRDQLLQNNDIHMAYHSIKQHPEWTPHLTLGYPSSPAKRINTERFEGDPSSMKYVLFDRIALWTGDYEGREFALKTDAHLEDVAHSTILRGEKYMEHYGVKGMKWGVIRDRAAGAVKTAYKPSDDAIKSKKYMTRAKLGGVQNLSNREMQLVINRMNLERQYKELYGERQLHTAGVRWAGKFLNDVLKDAATSWLSNPFNRSKRRDQGPYRTRAWTTGQQLARTIDGSARQIGA